MPDQLQSEAAIMENAEKVVLAGLLMIKSITAITFKSGCLLKLRVGIHSGDVIAGIIGLWKFKYDLWGTDVDVASAIEQSGKENTPHISEDTFDLLKTNALFTFSKSEPLEVAGSRVFNTFDVRYAESRTGRSLVEWREVVATMYRRAVIENQLSSSDGSGGLNHQIDIVDNESLLQHQQPAAIYTTSPTPPSYNRQSCLATAESGFLTFDEPAVAFTVPSLSVQSSPVNGLVGGGGGQRMQFSYSDNNYRSRSNLDLLNGNMRDVDISVPIQTRSKMSQTMLQFSVETNPLTSRLLYKMWI